MLRRLKQFYGDKLDALDGEIGHVKDFYFDDRSWLVHYVVAETGTWLMSRQVLLSPHAIGSLFQDGRAMVVNLTRKQIEDSPPIERHQPISRQFEDEYHRYYGWPHFWEGDGACGDMRGLPILEKPYKVSAKATAEKVSPKTERAEAHLRSAQAVNGYHLQASDGIIGQVCDFVMDEDSWSIGELVIKIGHRFSGDEVLVPANCVNRISYEESTVFVNLTKAAVRQSPAQQLFLDGVGCFAEDIQ